MKIVINIFLFLFIMCGSSVFAQNFDKFDGIPVEVGYHKAEYFINNPAFLDSMRLAGVDIIRTYIDLTQPDPGLSTLNSYGFKLIPAGIKASAQNIYNYIQYYTDAKYKVWEAEGLPVSDSLASLEPNLINSDLVHSGDTLTYVRLKSAYANVRDTMITGPYNWEEVHYYANLSFEDTTVQNVLYAADFRMKLENNPFPPLPHDTTSDNPTTPLCILQVTQSHPNSGTTPWHFDCTYVIAADTLTLNDFNQLNQFQSIQIPYTLENDSCYFYEPGPQPPYPIVNRDNLTSSLQVREDRRYIQYKVIWLGNTPNYLLSVDKVTVSDGRGRELETPGSLAITNIHNELTALTDNGYSQYNDMITGWLGIDEPNSVDAMEPIRKVREILDNFSASPVDTTIIFPLMGRWSYAWQNSNDPFGMNGYPYYKQWAHFAGNMHIWSDIYMFDNPYNEGCTFSDSCGHYREANIWSTAKFNYQPAHDYLDHNMGVSIQCGGARNVPQVNERNVKPNELLYQTNLALMFGAKALSLYPYFAIVDSCADTGTIHALIDRECNYPHQYIYTPRYNIFRYTINPRLKGIMGKTLKKLEPSEDHLQVPIYSGVQLNFNNIKSVYPNQQPCDDIYFEIGFFHDPLNGYNSDKKYFMLLNRYYSDSIADDFQIELRNLLYYHNWTFFDYRDSASAYTLTPNSTGIVTSNLLHIPTGDAAFISISPVLEFGGSMVVNDTIGSNISLNDTDLVINNGASLVIDGTYDCYKDIILKSGAVIKTLNYSGNPKITFHDGHKIRVEGSVSIIGAAGYILTLDFTSSPDKGIEVDSGAALSISYCKIQNASNGIFANNHISHLDVSDCSFTNCDTSAIFINSFGSSGGGLSPSGPTIQNNTISGSHFGISVSNTSNITIQYNTITNTDAAIYFSQVSNSQIVHNTITSNKKTLPGILYNSSSGNIRLNTITGHYNGINLANSSPTIGNNFIYGNKVHGLYVSSRSNPDLSADLVQIPGTQPPLFYGYSGYNEIYENGDYSGGNNISDDDGSEIYINASSIILNKPQGPGDNGSGCNSIYDDRTTPDSSRSLILLSGQSVRDTVDARNQYWGNRSIYSGRFSGINVKFIPYGDGPCPMPIQPSGNALVVSNLSGGTVDTLYPVSSYSGNLSTINQQYAAAENYYITDSLNQANQIYNQIVTDNPADPTSLQAYVKLFMIKKLQGGSVNDFIQLRNSLLSNLNSMSDSLMIGVVQHLTDLCLVNQQQYTAAIDSFNTIIQQFPNTDQALSASIDILTTSLLVNNGGNQLGKRIGKELIAKSSSDYQSKLLNLLQSKFGRIKSETGKENIPKVYTLYHNYPNPFNPTTTIKYDLPKAATVTLKIYDILGREVKTLVDHEMKTAGSYRVVFDASNLASGVYLYRLQTNDYVNVKKMILLK